MKAAFLILLLAVFVLPLRAEDWTTSDGKTYRDVKVVSHDDAYVTILHDDGGGRILLSTLSPDLQKRFNYDPVKAANAIAAVAAADQRDKDALAQEKAQAAAQNSAGQQQIASAVATASLPPPPSGPDSSDTSAPSAGDGTTDQPPIANAPPTEIDDYDDGGYIYGAGYGGGYYGYGSYSHGASFGNHYGMRGFNRQLSTPGATSRRSMNSNYTGGSANSTGIRTTSAASAHAAPTTAAGAAAVSPAAGAGAAAGRR